MTNSYNPPKGPDLTSGLVASNARQLQQLDRFQAAQRQNDQREIQNAKQQEQLLQNLVGFSTTLKGYLDKREAKKEKAEQEEVYTNLSRLGLTSNDYTTLNQIELAKQEGRDYDKLIAKIEDPEKREYFASLNPDQQIYAAQYNASNFANHLPALIENNKEAIGLTNVNLSVSEQDSAINKYISQIANESGIAPALYGKYVLPELTKHKSTILKNNVKANTELKQAQLAEITNKTFRDALNLNTLADTYDEHVQKLSATKGRPSANLEGYEILKQLASEGSLTENKWNDFKNTVKPHDGAKGGKALLEKRFSQIQLDEIDNLIEVAEEKKLDALKLKKKNDFRQINNAAIENTNQRYLDGEDPRALIRDLERIQGANKKDFGMTDDRLDKKIEALNKSEGSFDAHNAYFDELYGKGLLTAEMVEETEDPKLMDQWLGRAQTQDKARYGDDYKDSKDSVISLVKGADKIFAKTGGASGLNPSANAVASLLKNKFEAKVTQLVDLEDPNAAVNAALFVKKYWTENGGGQPILNYPNALFGVDVNNSFPNYEKKLGGDASIAAKKITEFEKLNIKTKIDMSGGNAQRALDTPNVFLNESEVKEAIERINDGDGYSVKLKLVSGLYPTLGGPQEILDRQAAALDIEAPERQESIETIYKQGNPFINCLINERGIEGLSTNQLLRQCRALDENFELPTRN